MTNFADRDGMIWYDGELRPWRDATVHVLNYTLHYGVGCFEGIRAYATDQGAAVFRLQEHSRRLLNSARILGMPINWTAGQIDAAIIEVLRANQLAEAYIRPMAFYGSENMGLHCKGLSTHLIIAAWRWGTYLGEENLSTGIRVKTASIQRHHINAAMVHAKANGYYINSSMALNEVLQDGYDEAIMLDTDGHVAEGSGENIFLVVDGRLHTPDVTSCLDGITRRTVIQLARETGIEVFERRITRDEIYLADEAFFTGTAAEVTPIREADNRPIGNGKRGVLTERLQRTYMDLVNGRMEQHQAWLTWV